MFYIVRHPVVRFLVYDRCFGTRSLLFPVFTGTADSFMGATTVGTFDDHVLTMQLRASPGRVPISTGSTGEVLVWALREDMPVFLASLALPTPAFSTIRPIGVDA
jgi:hypothetical protein